MRLTNRQTCVQTKQKKPNGSAEAWAFDIEAQFRSESVLSVQKRREMAHLGSLVKYVRTARSFSRQNVADKMKKGRRGKRLRWIKELEDSGKATSTVFEDICFALGVSEKTQQRWHSHIEAVEARKKRALVSSRLIKEGERLVRLRFSNSPSFQTEYFERKALAEKLGFLVENCEVFMNELRFRSVIIPHAYVLQNVRDNASDLLGKSVELLPEPIPLGLLIHLWTEGAGIIEIDESDEPLHIVRVVADAHLSHFWVEGILQKSRKWKQVWVPRLKLIKFIERVSQLCSDYFQEQETTLWRNFRKYYAFQSAWETSRLLMSQDVNDADWASSLRLPSWIDGSTLSSLRQSWMDAITELGEHCEKPLCDAFWSEELTRFDWISLSPSERWSRWRRGVSAGVNDHRGRRWTEDAFEKALERCLTQTYEIPSFVRVLEEQGDDSYAIALSKHRKRVQNDRFAQDIFEN